MPTRQRRNTAATPARVQLGIFWLWYRKDRDDWSICWLDGRTTRRRSTGVGGGSENDPPKEAEQALAKHFVGAGMPAASQEPDQRRSPKDVLLAEITRLWLREHVAHLHSPERYANSLLVLQRFYDDQRSRKLLADPLTVASVNRSLTSAFTAWRLAEGVSPATVSRDLAALRGPINWALREEIIDSAPRVAEVRGKRRSRELEYSPQQVAAILEAAWAAPERRHVHLYAMIHLSTHGRSEAILELMADQVRGNLIHFNATGREQTRKHRSVVPVAPTLEPWLRDLEGKAIRYRVPTSAETRLNGGLEYFERETTHIRRSFEACLVAAHRAHPHLDLAKQAVDAAGELVWLPARPKLGETEPRVQMVGVGSPNTLRHTIHTWHQRYGVPQAQIDAAAGHSTEQGSGANYTHLRPEYLAQFIASTEAFWSEVGKHTRAHLRYQCDTKLGASKNFGD